MTTADRIEANARRVHCGAYRIAGERAEGQPDVRWSWELHYSRPRGGRFDITRNGHPWADDVDPDELESVLTAG